MDEQNYITLSSEKLEFHGFSKLSKRITFCFYDAGVVISPTERTGRPNYFTANIDEDNCITDKNIIDILLRDRLYSEIEYFIYSGDSYIEMELHKSTL